MQANLTPELSQLLEQITGDRSDAAAVRIQIGRSVAYKGTVNEPEANSLTPEQVSELSVALAQAPDDKAALKSALTISVDGETVYRSSAKEGVTLNSVSTPSELAVSEPIEAVVQPAPIEVVEVQELPVVQSEPDGATIVAGDNATVEATAVPQVDLADLAEPEPEPEPEPLQQAMAVDAVEEVEEVDLAPAAVAEPAAATIEPTKPTGATLSGSEVFMLEMHEPGMAADQTKQWLYDQFQDMAQSQLVQSLQKEGAHLTRTALAQVAKVPGATVERGVADSIVALTKQFGAVADTAEGKRFKYQSESYDVTVRGTNHYTLSDKVGNTLFAFRHSSLQVQATAPCKLSLSQRFEVMQAGASLTSSQARQVAKSGIEGMQTMAQQLAGLAPAGTRERLVQMQQVQVVKIAEALVSSKQAISTAAGRTFSGTQFQVFKSPSALRVFAQDGRGELLSKVGDQVKGRMNGLDLAQAGKTAQMLLRSVQNQMQRNMGNTVPTKVKAEVGR